MAKLVIVFCALYIPYSAPLEVPFFILPTYSEELKAASTKFRTEVISVINQGQTVVTECNELLETSQDYARSLQDEVSDIVNNTLTEFGKDVIKLLADVSIDVSECTALSFAIESEATDILVSTNICIHDKLDAAEMYIDKTISSIQYTMARLDSIRKLVDDNFNVTMRNENMITVLLASIFLKAISSEPSHAAFEILSFSTTTRLGISRINSLMILDCVPAEAVASLVNNKQFVYSKIENCIANLHPLETNLLANDLHRH